MIKLSLICRTSLFIVFLSASVSGLLPCYSANAQVAVIEDQAFDFGKFSFVNMANAIEIIVTPTGSYSSNSDVVILTTPKNGEYTMTGGPPSTVYNISVSSSVTLNGGGAGTLTADNFSVSPATSSFDAFGEAQLKIGGRLRSSGGGTQYGNGAYNNTLTVTVSY